MNPKPISLRRTILTAGPMFLFGAALVVVAVIRPSLPSIVIGIGSGLLGGAGSVLVGALYWTRPSNHARYQRRLEDQRIKMNDELMQHLRYRSGWAAYLATMALVTTLIIVLSIVSITGISGLRTALLGLGGLLAFMWVSGIVAYQAMARNYR